MNIHGRRLRDEIESGRQIAFTGIYDTFSATLAARYSDSLFVSGFGFAASFYGLPDIGFISWSDMTQFVQRLRSVLPDHHLLVDIDDGYGDPEVACHVVSILESIGASGVVLEDQQRPRRCGHFDGKQLMETAQYVEKLKRVLAARRDIAVIARTDASDIEDITERVVEYAKAGADAILVDGLRDLRVIRELKTLVDKPFTFNQIAGGKSPMCTLGELENFGVSLVIYSTPCLFAAQSAIDDALRSLADANGRLPDASAGKGVVGVKSCTAVLQENLERRAGKLVSA